MATYKYFRVICRRIPKDQQQNRKAAKRPFPGRLLVENTFATVYTYKGQPMGTFEFTEQTGAPVVGAEYVFSGGGREVRVRLAEELLLDRTSFVPFGRAVCRLVREDGFPGLKFTERAVEEYGKFFQLAALRPELALVPSTWVEKVWQRHILDTQEYAADCGACLPHFLHYNPSRAEEEEGLTSEESGSEGEAAKEQPRKASAWEATLQAYREEFGVEAPAEIWGSPGKGIVALAPPKSLKHSPKTVDELDLSYLMPMLLECKEYTGGEAQIRECMKEYQRFLKLHFETHELKLVPSRLVDLVWHAHALHTHQYFQDCHALFGRMFWHFPEYITLPPSQPSGIPETNELYAKVYGEEPPKAVWGPVPQPTPMSPAKSEKPTKETAMCGGGGGGCRGCGGGGGWGGRGCGGGGGCRGCGGGGCHHPTETVNEDHDAAMCGGGGGCRGCGGGGCRGCGGGGCHHPTETGAKTGAEKPELPQGMCRRCHHHDPVGDLYTTKETSLRLWARARAQLARLRESPAAPPAKVMDLLTEQADALHPQAKRQFRALKAQGNPLDFLAPEQEASLAA